MDKYKFVKLLHSLLCRPPMIRSTKRFQQWPESRRLQGVKRYDIQVSKVNTLNKSIDGTCPHDPVAIIEGICTGLTCKYKRSWFYVHPTLGYTIFVTDPYEGPHYGTCTINADKFLDFLGKAMLKHLSVADISKYNS
eukprot:TRINITY_DN2811_c0_g1_i1.p3 TRINITY_DN2811_c0_g1~~TRINITY_DN2811_c0_g1_i1.p3  ORF type:complete len:137 (+),score=7.09 TRINITY_DN2811_c0_g1_i1:349-759(+)